jgi:hypothetical protein
MMRNNNPDKHQTPIPEDLVHTQVPLYLDRFYREHTSLVYRASSLFYLGLDLDGMVLPPGGGGEAVRSTTYTSNR